MRPLNRYKLFRSKQICITRGARDLHNSMNVIDLQSGVDKALNALFADRLALLCGAGLSMAPPSSIPSAATLAGKAKQKYDSTYGTSRPALAESIDDQTEFFFQRGELADVYLRSYIDHDAFAAEPNDGHFAAADLLLTGGIGTAVSTCGFRCDRAQHSNMIVPIIPI